ncbi:MAG: TolC family protein [Planctomycetaceae bacterium]|nr:TolC family protein [Planctomycetaceae bacterium]
MRWSKSIRWLNAILLSGAVAGCHTPKTLHYFGDADLGYYKDRATAVEYAAVDQETPAEVVYSHKPRTVKDREQDEVWDLTLEEAMHTAIANNKMIRQRSSQGQLLANPTNFPSVYDPALRASGFLFGNRGVEGALSDFDAQFSTSMMWGRNEQVSNSLFTSGTLPPGFESVTETAQFQSQLSKTIATGGNLALSHNWNYLGSNSPGLLFPSSYNGLVNLGYTQPLWAGAGVEFNRIAGPSRGGGFGAITGVNQGVTIARINEDISIADFESAVIAMTKDVEDLYWELYLSYRQFDAENANRDSALRSWREVKAKMEVGAAGGNAAAEAQARENYFDTRARVEVALGAIFRTENQFRRMLGLPVNDGRIIRPADDPLRAEYHLNWEMALSESLTRRVELRRQKWQVKSLELQRVAAENACNPQLNFVSNYNVNGFGNDLLQYDSDDGITAEGYDSAYSTLTRGDQTGWGLGLQFAMPIGLRTARAQLHNTELQLVKSRTALAAQELDISHDLAESIQNLDQAYMTAKTNFDRRVASERRVQATEAEYEAGVRDATLDLVLRAQASKAAAEIAYFTSLVNYNKAIVELNRQRGTLLDVNGISLAEGAWMPEANEEALRRAWARSFGKPNEKLETLPAEFSSPVPYPKTDLFPGVPINATTPIPDGAMPPAAPAAEPYEAPVSNTGSALLGTTAEPPVLSANPSSASPLR